MTVSYFYRKPGKLYSIERVFGAVREAMGPEVSARGFFCRYRRGFPGLLYNLVEARGRQSAVNHITGDVHYLALALTGKRTVLTVHDCGILGSLKGWRRELVRLLWFEWPARRVAAVTVISESARAELLRFTSCPPSKIQVIPDPLLSGYEWSPRAFDQGNPRILQVGTRENKNLENVALALVGLPCTLTIVGGLSGAQSSLLHSLGLSYTALEDLSDAEMLEAYRASDLVVFCSTYEGFGMPVMEANALGRPVVASDIEPIRGVAGDAACLVDPHDVASIREGVLRVVGDAAYREDLVARGRANAARFHARGIAARYLEIYNAVANP